MKIKHGRSRDWERAADRGAASLHARILREYKRQLRRRKAKRDRGLTRTIPLARRKLIKAGDLKRRLQLSLSPEQIAAAKDMR